MTNNPQIRIRKQDKDEYKRLAKNTKAKLKRVKDKYGIDLSDEVDLPSLDSFKTRGEFNQWKEQQKSFTNIGNTKYQFVTNVHGVPLDKQSLYRVKEDTKKAQRIAEKLKEDMMNKPFISGGVQQGTVGGRLEMVAKPNVAGIYSPPDFNFDQYTERGGLLDKIENMRQRANPDIIDIRTKRMKDNFIEGLQESFNSDADELIVKLKKIDPRDFYQMYMMYDEIDFYIFYDDDGERVTGQISVIESYIDRYEKGKVSMELRDF